MKAANGQEQFVIDAQGKKIAVILDLKTYDRLREAEEEVSDIRAFNAAWPQAQKDLGNGDVITLAELKRSRVAKRK